MAKKRRNIITALDIGTTQTRTLIAELDENSQLTILGVGTVPTEGLKRGMVKDLDSVTQSIAKSVRKAMDIANVDVTKLIVGISGTHIKCQNVRAGVEVANPMRGITEEDVERVLKKANEMVTPKDRQVIHVLVQEYIVDDESGIKDPIGFAGTRLEAEIHVVTGSIASAQNIIKCVRQAGITEEEIVLNPIASSQAVLSEDEKELGVIMADIGGGTTDAVIFGRNGIRHIQIIPLGGDHITGDIAERFRVTHFEAENIKRKYGCADVDLVAPEEQFEICDLVGREPQLVSRKILAETIQARIEDICEMIKAELEQVPQRYRRPAGVVLTGGVTLLPGVKEVAQRVFNLPVRIGAPYGLRGLSEAVNSPIYSTGVGLILFGLEERATRPPELVWWKRMVRNAVRWLIKILTGSGS